MLSGTAQRIYRVAAVLSIVFFMTAIAVRVTGGIPNYLFPVVMALLLAGVLGAATTIVAMEYFLFGFDKSSAWKRAFWFCVMTYPPFGPALYYFVVYSRSDAVKSNCQKAVQRVSA
jgi:hypothetical protein